MRPLYWLLTLTVAFASYWLLSQYVNVLLAVIFTAWISCGASMIGIVASDSKTAPRADKDRSEPAE